MSLAVAQKATCRQKTVKERKTSTQLNIKMIAFIRPAERMRNGAAAEYIVICISSYQATSNVFYDILRYAEREICDAVQSLTRQIVGQ